MEIKLVNPKEVLNRDGYLILESDKYYVYKYVHPEGVGSYEFIEERQYTDRVKFIHNGKPVPPHITGMMMQIMGWEEFVNATLAIQKCLAMADSMTVGEKIKVMQRCYILSLEIISKFYPMYQGMALEVIVPDIPDVNIIDTTAGNGGFFKF